MRDRLDPTLAEGAAWKLLPPRVFADRYEIALDNDCILWRMPPAILDWLGAPPDGAGCVLAADVTPCFG